MRKILISISLIWLFTCLVSPAGINVDKPVNGQTIYKVNTTGYMIKWTVSGDITKNVKIRLLNKTGTTKIYDITNSTPIAPGQYLWTKNLINNTDIGDYVIRVKTIDDKYSDDSGLFYIRNKILDLLVVDPKFAKKPFVDLNILMGKIKVSEPVKNEKYQAGKAISIKWDKNFGNYEYVWVYIYYIGGTDHIAIRGTNMKNTGVSSWTPTSDYNKNPIYVEVKTLDKKFSGKSGIFSLFIPTSQLL